MKRKDNRITDCPCDTCPQKSSCAAKATDCKGFRDWAELGWTRPVWIQHGIKNLKMRKQSG